MATAWRKLAQPKDGTLRIEARGGPLNGSYLRIHPEDQVPVAFPGGIYHQARADNGNRYYRWAPTEEAS
jgi:hypothetical protein